MQESTQRPTPGIVAAAGVMILFGVAEVVTGFTHTFFGITTSRDAVFTASSAAIGVCYVAAGLLVLTMRRWAATLAIALLVVDIIGRIALVVAGLYPTDSLKNTFSIVAGTVIVALLAGYLAWRWKAFR